ncbi:MAG: LTA synthase family protein [Pseudoflavonifractor sp.]
MSQATATARSAAAAAPTAFEQRQTRRAEQYLRRRALELKLTDRLAAWRGRPRRSHAPWRDNALIWYILFFAAPLVLLLTAQLISVQDAAAVNLWLAACSRAAFLTYVLLLALETLLLALTGRLFLSNAILSAAVLFISMASHFKEVINGVPLMVSDITMVGNVGDIANFIRPGMKLGVGTWQGIWLVLPFLAVMAVFALHPRPNLRLWRSRLRAGIACTLILVLSGSFLPTRAFLDGPGEGEMQAERNDRLGILAGLYSGVLASSAQAPNIYNENNMNGILMKLQHYKVPTPKAEVQPNVIMLMSESFCDPKLVLPGVEFQDDPIPNYRALSQTFPAGEFRSNTYAGGTGNVEMEVLTGVPLGFLSESEDLTALSDKTSYGRMPSIVKAFAADGYNTEFVHSYTPNLYNRQENLPAIGFQKLLFCDDFPEDVEHRAGYISDQELTKKLISEFENKEENKPLFLFGLSVENHQPYFTDKFDSPSGVRFKSKLLDAEGMGEVETLVHGIHDADAALGELLDYLETCGEPTMVVFWGDHLPGLYLDDEHSIYSVLGYSNTVNSKTWSPEMMKRMHSTQYLVWNNYGATPEVPKTVSTLNLGTNLLDWAGVPKPLYYTWVDLAMGTMLSYRERLYVSAAGAPYYAPPDEDKKVVDTYRSIVYDMLYGEQYITDQITALPQ